MRGRYASGGIFNPHIQETADGVDMFAWTAVQPWSHGIALNQREVEMSDGVLAYSTSVLDLPLEVTGLIELCLFVSSSARDTDFTGKLVGVYQDGRGHHPAHH